MVWQPASQPGPKPSMKVAPRGSAAAPSRGTAAKEELGAAPRPRLIGVKQELGSGDSSREAKIRAMAAKIRAEARAKAGLTPEDGDDDMVEDTSRPTGPGPIKRKAESMETDPRKEEEESQRLDALLPVLEQRVASAEEEAEKVTIVAAPLAMDASEELRTLQSGAIRETEKAVKAGVLAVAAARREVEKRLAEVEAFSSLARDNGKGEIQKLLERIDAAAAKVDEYRNVRRDHEQAIAAEKLVGELAARLGSIEVDCEKAAMMAEPLARTLASEPEAVSGAELRESREAVRLAQATLAPTTRLISGKVAGLKGPVRKRMQELLTRAENAQGLLDKAQQTVDEGQSSVAAGPILKEAVGRIEKVEEAMQEMRETEAPFLMGIEIMPADESDEILQSMDKAAKNAQSVCADAHKFLSLKLVEVGRFCEGTATSAKRELERAREQVDTAREKVRAFMEDLVKRRRQNLVVQVKEKIEGAEAAVLTLKELGAELQHVEGGEIAEALDRALSAELEAQNAVTTARRELQQRQQELRPSEGGSGGAADAVKSNSELLRTRVRIQYMESELSKFRKVARTLEERIKVGKSLTVASSLLEKAESEVAGLAEAVASWADNEKPPENIQPNIVGVQKKLTSTTTQVEMKLHTAQGLELKELRGIFGRLQNAQGRLDSVKDTVKFRSRAFSGQVVRGAADAVRQAEAQVTALCSEAAKANIPAERLGELSREAQKSLAVAASAAQLLESQERQGLPMESRVEFARLQLRCKALQRKGKNAADRLTSRFEKLAEEAENAALDALRLSAQREGDQFDAEGLFQRLSSGTGEITEVELCEFLAQAEPPMSEDRARIAYRRIAPYGLQCRIFVAALASFLRVAREVTLTDDFDVQTGKKLKKLHADEVVEALGAPRDDSRLGLSRLRVRVLRDGTVGWATLRSNSGLVFLERVPKPYLCCSEAIELRETMEAATKQVGRLIPGDVVELVEGPHEERLTSDRRVRGVACSEDSLGWLQVSDSTGKVLAEVRTNIFKCSEAIAMTDVADFASCALVRRLEAGEAVELLEDAEVAPTEGGMRKKFRACADGRVGWVTTEGSQGTVYLRPAQRHYICIQAAPLHAGLGAEAPVVRIMMPGEAFAAYEEPREVSGGDSLKTYLVRGMKDGVEGWLTASVKNEVQKWTTTYKVLRPSPLTSTFAANEAAEPVEVTRLLEPGELVRLAEPPNEDISTGQLRVRCCAVQDEAVGWATVREAVAAGATVLMEPAAKEDLAQLSADASGDVAPMTPPAAPSTPPRGQKRVKEEIHEDAPWGKAAKGKGKGGKGKGKGKGKYTR